MRVRFRILESHFDVKGYLHSIPEAGAAALQAYEQRPRFFQGSRGRADAVSGATWSISGAAGSRWSGAASSSKSPASPRTRRAPATGGPWSSARWCWPC